MGLKHLIVFINTCDAADEEMIELVEMEIRELLEEKGFSEDNTPIVKRSALCALEDTKPELGVEAISQLIDVVDNTIPTPGRNLYVPFLMPSQRPGQGVHDHWEAGSTKRLLRAR